MRHDLRVLVNAESLIHPLTGIGKYAQALVSEFVDMLGPEKVDCYRFGALGPAREMLDAFNAANSHSVARQTARMRVLGWVAQHSVFPYLAHQFMQQRRFRAAGSRLSPGTIYHEPNYILKPWAGPCVATVHDLSTFRYPHHHPRSRVDFVGRNLQRTLSHADRVITDSQLVRDELIERFDVAPEKVRAIHLGVASSFRPIVEKTGAAWIERFGLNWHGYTLCLATFEPRKNLGELIDAFERLPARLQAAFPLVVAGAAGWGSNVSGQRLARLVREGRAVNLGYVPENSLPALLSGAALFVFPSLYEGFGLPVLEAMACGTPVVTSRGSAMAEFAEHAAALVDPEDADELAGEMERLLEDGGAREELATRGLVRAAALTWRRCAEAHLEVYEEAVKAWRRAGPRS